MLFSDDEMTECCFNSSVAIVDHILELTDSVYDVFLHKELSRLYCVQDFIYSRGF